MAIGYTLNGELEDVVLTSIHVTKDKRLFEYEESQIVPLCWEWVVCFRKFWEKSSLIYIEKQISYHRGRERGCLLIQFTLHSIFLTLHMMGKGPKPVTMRASWWKEQVGLEIGNHKGTDGHEENKLRSIALFKKKKGMLAVDAISRKWGKVDDIVDVTHMLEALMIKHDELSHPFFHSNHKETPGIIRIKKEDRQRRLPTLMDPDTDVDHCHLRNVYNEFKERRAKQATTRRNDNRMKKLNKADVFRKRPKND